MQFFENMHVSMIKLELHATMQNDPQFHLEILVEQACEHNIKMIDLISFGVS
jgi:hypothetical protein